MEKLSNSKSSNNVVLARLGKPRGLKGEVVLHIETDRPREVLGPGNYTLSDGQKIDVLELVDCGNDKWSWMLGPEWPPERIKSLANTEVVVPADALPPRGEGEYSESDIVGLTVIDTLGRERGTVVRIERRYEIETWIIAEPRGTESELAAIESYIKEIDLERRTLTIAPNALLRP